MHAALSATGDYRLFIKPRRALYRLIDWRNNKRASVLVNSPFFPVGDPQQLAGNCLPDKRGVLEHVRRDVRATVSGVGQAVAQAQATALAQATYRVQAAYAADAKKKHSFQSAFYAERQ
jgi:hypothetical protein